MSFKYEFVLISQVEQEKSGSAEDQNAMFARLAGKVVVLYFLLLDFIFLISMQSFNCKLNEQIWEKPNCKNCLLKFSK